MDMNEIVEKVGRNNLKKALESDNPNDFKELIENAGLSLNDEQLEAIAGGFCGTSGSCSCYSWS
ncbi:MAG TPA: hypothetical protein DCP91_02285 [Eggerthellaceae bacterium]|nr:hypothetical protein [Eggerthellaceae bacterium]